jgi:hypothetical protein
MGDNGKIKMSGIGLLLSQVKITTPSSDDSTTFKDEDELAEIDLFDRPIKPLKYTVKPLGNKQIGIKSIHDFEEMIEFLTHARIKIFPHAKPYFAMITGDKDCHIQHAEKEIKHYLKTGWPTDQCSIIIENWYIQKDGGTPSIVPDDNKSGGKTSIENFKTIIGKRTGVKKTEINVTEKPYYIMFSGEMHEVENAKEEVKYYLENLGARMPRGDKLNKEVHIESDKEKHSDISAAFRVGLIEW